MREPEIKTVYIPGAEYIKKYRHVEKFEEYCKVCPRYNKCWACPQFDFDPRTLTDPYHHVYLIGAKIFVDQDLIENTKGKEAVAAMAETITKEARKKMDGILLSLEKTVPHSLCCYGGTCYLCGKCQKEIGNPCIHPEERRSSLEAIGFDVAATTEDLLGFKLLWSEDRLPEYITVVSALFTKDLVLEGI